MHRFERIVVIAATSEIAREVTERLLRAHPVKELVLVARDGRALDVLAQDWGIRFGVKVQMFRSELGESLDAFVLTASIRNLMPHPDLVFLAQGVLVDEVKAESEPGYIESVIAVNYTSVVQISYGLLSLLSGQKGQKLVLAVIGSVAGDRGRSSNPLYGSAKAGVATFLEGFAARHEGVGLHVSIIKPGRIDTRMTAALPRSFLTSSLEAAAKAIARGITQGHEVIYAPFHWVLVSLVVRCLPSFVLRRLRL